jgi:DNA-binding transcriptional regulator YhcF (GntR family)
VKLRLLAKIRSGVAKPGARFLSNRAIARHFHISYQTADNLVRELVQEGHLERRPASGTYYPGGNPRGLGVLLIFHPRAKRKNSFGSQLLEKLTAALDEEKIDWRMSWTTTPTARFHRLPLGRYPVIWERLDAMQHAIDSGRHALLLNHRPPPGLGSESIDSVSVDDFSGGASAAQYLKTLHPQARRISILAGPVGDSRSAARVEGFRSVAGGTVFASPTWYYEGALTVADRVIAAGTDGIFCCADRLAEGVVRRCIARGIKRPLLISFDDAPIAQWLNLTTMAISWNEMVGAAIRVIKQRQVDQTSSAIAQLVSTKLIVRS